jgi:superfamily I DNA/RNA helicase
MYVVMQGDLVLNLHRRLCRFGRPAGLALHQIVADEVQDFTQAEIKLLICMSANPNDLVLAGDTAQNINRGVGFRFADIKTLFRQAEISLQQQQKRAQKNENSLQRIQDPMWLELRFNYRSHSGILNVAAAVCELLYHFFKGSLDRLPPDTGLFEGPKPVLLNLDTVDELVLLLLGNQRTTTQIEFGAQQVVLVRNEDAREALPEDLRAGLVMTVFEAKGLEFDDVILYNFFADSPAEKEWICVNGYNDEEQETEDNGTNGTSGSGMLREVAWSELEGHQPQASVQTEARAQAPNAKSSAHRRREFNTDADRLLNSELKHLYTAVTRPRVNLWIFDEHKERRGPMFRFLKRRGLCEMIDDIDTATEEGVELFAKTSTAEDWLKQGRHFLQKRSSVDDKKAALAIAVKCFKKV